MTIQDSNFYHKLLEITSELQMKPEDLLNVMALESGIDPSAHNKNGNASGLLQFMPKTLKGLGFQGTHADFRSLSAIQQLDFVKKLIQNNMRYNGGPFKSAAQYYVANFLPVALRLPGIKQEDPKTIIVAKDPIVPHLPNVSLEMEKEFYEANPILDFDHDGFITYGDIQSILKSVSKGKTYLSSLSQLAQSTGYQPSTSSRNMLANKTKNTSNIDDIINQYLQQVLASEKKCKNIYKKYLPNNQFVIKVNSKDFLDKIEFARILCAALNEELLAEAFTHTSNDNVEIDCRIKGPLTDCHQAIENIVDVVKYSFEYSTVKINAKINTKIVNGSTILPPLLLNAAQQYYRKFLLKFV